MRPSIGGGNTLGNFFVLATLLSLTACATTYKSTGVAGGFEDLRLGDNIFQVEFHGNGFTSSSLVDKFLLRRCAELTLENGLRYFVINSSASDESYQAGGGVLYTFPSGKALIQLLSHPTTAMALDAVVIIEETNEIAKGRISPEAKAAVERFSQSIRDLRR